VDKVRPFQPAEVVRPSQKVEIAVESSKVYLRRYIRQVIRMNPKSKSSIIRILKWIYSHSQLLLPSLFFFSDIIKNTEHGQGRLITASRVSRWDRDSLSINHLSSPDQKADLISKARKPLSLSPQPAASLFSVLKHHLPYLNASSLTLPLRSLNHNHSLYSTTPGTETMLAPFLTIS
jgi:hypothetical protein